MRHVSSVLLICVLPAVLGCTQEKVADRSDAPADSVIVVPSRAIQSGQVGQEAARSVALADTVALTGEIQSDPLRTTHVATRVAGTVQSVSVVVGSLVRLGEVLSTVYSPEFLAAESDFLLAHERLERAATGAEQDVVTLQSIVQSSRRRLEVLGASAHDIAEIERTHRALDLLTLRSPRTGIVTDVSAAVGKQLTAGEDLFGVTDPTVVWAVVNAHEQDLAALHPGQSARVTANAYPLRVFSGRVTTLEGSLDEASRTLKVRISVPNSDAALKPGMFVTAQIASGQTHQAVVLPEAAVQDFGDAKVVFVAHSNSTFVSRPVAVRPLGGDLVEILRGLTAGTPVAVRGAFLVRSQAQKAEMGDE